METYIGYVEDAEWKSRWKPEWKNRYFVDDHGRMFFDVHFPSFRLTTVRTLFTENVLQLQLAMGIPPVFRQLDDRSLWKKAFDAHKNRQEIVFSTAKNDTVHVNGDGESMPKEGRSVILRYRDEPKDVSVYKQLWKDCRIKLNPIRKRIQYYQEKLEEYENKEYETEQQYEKKVKTIRDECVKKSKQT
jgi:hypothetical protein